MLQLVSKGKKKMQEQDYVKQHSGAKAIRIDNRLFIARIRILQFLALILSAAFALGLHLIFAR